MRQLSKEERSTRRLGYIIGIALLLNVGTVVILFVGMLLTVVLK